MKFNSYHSKPGISFVDTVSKPFDIGSQNFEESQNLDQHLKYKACLVVNISPD